MQSLWVGEGGQRSTYMKVRIQVHVYRVALRLSKMLVKIVSLGSILGPFWW